MSVNPSLPSHTPGVAFTKHLVRLGSTAFFLLLLMLIWSHPAQAATCTWTGSSSTDWHSAGNWNNCGGVVPTNSDSVTIPNVANDPVVSSDATVAALDLGVGGNLTINSGQTLTVDGLSTLAASSISGSGIFSTASLNLNSGCCSGAITLNPAITVGQALTVTDVGSVNGTAINILGDFRSNDADLAGNMIFRLAGSGDQTLTGSGRVNNLDIAKPSGDVLIPSNFTISGGTFSGTGSRLKNTGGTIVFGIETINFTGSIDDVAINAGCCTGAVVTLAADLTVNNSLIITDVQSINGRAINIGGTFRSNDADLAGNTIFRLAGAGDQTLTGSGRVNNLDIAKSGGDVLIPSNLNISGGTFSGTGSRLKNTGGTVIFGAGTISFTGSIDDVAFNAGCCTGSSVTLAADLTVNNSLTMTDVQSINGAAINIGGTFRSNDADLAGNTIFRLNGSGDQTLTGTGRVNNLDIAKPSGDVLIPSNLNISGGTFSGVSGHLVNTGGTIIFGIETISFTGSIDDVAINAGCCTGAVVTLGATLTVNNSLTMTDVQSINGAAINIGGTFRSNDADLAGNTIFRLNGSGDQTLTGTGRVNNLDIAKPSGDVLIPSNLNISGGTFSGVSGHLVNTGGTIIFGIETISFTGSIDDVAINAGCCTGSVVTLGADLTVNNSLTMTDVQSINGAAINIGGTFRSNDADLAGNTIFRLNGSGDQTLTGSGRVNNLDIAKPSGDVLIPSNFNINGGTFTGTGSRLKNTGGIILLGTETISFTGSIDDVNIVAAFNQNLVFSADLTVNNNLTVTQVSQIIGKAIVIGGNLVSNDGDLLSTTIFRLAGSGDQTLTGTGIIPNLDVAKSGGDVLIPSNFTIAGGSFTGTGSRFKNTGGAILFGSETVSFTGSIDDVNINAAFNQNLTLNADLTVNNNLSVTQILQVNGSKLNVAGNVSSSDGDMAGTSVVRLTSGSDQLITGTGKIANLEVAKSGGQVLFTGDRSFNSVILTSGNFGPNGFTVTSPVTVNGGTLGGQGKIVGAVTVNSGGTLNAGSSPGRLDLQGNLVMNSGSNLFVDINGNTPGSEHDQVVVTGTVTINSATLTGTTGIAPSQAITILANDSTDAIAGTRFVNAPNNGNSITLGNASYQIAYNGGSGNDIVLNLPPPSGLQVTNSSPTASGTATEFTATLSVGSGITYSWNFGDGSPVENGTSATTSHSYATAGSYVATVTAANAQGSISNTTPVTITLATLAPNTFADELNSDGDCSLREAIQAANTDSPVDLCPAGNGADTIQLAAGTYTLALSGADEDANVTGDLDATSTAGLTLVGAGPNSTIIDADGLDRAIHATAGALILTDLTIQNGNSPSKGGGVYASSSLTLTNTHFINNSAAGCCGGGVYSNGAASIADSLFSSNSAAGGGGGLYSFSTLNVTDSQFLSNTTSTQGGGAFALGTATIANSLFQSNRSTTYYGGGFYAGGNLTLVNSQFIGNRAGADGGGLHSAGVVTVYDSLFQSNLSESAQGGGMNVAESATISHSHFLSNTAAIGGGAFVYRAATLVGNLFQNNTSTYYGGGGLFVNNTLTLSDTQFIGNRALGPNGGGALSIAGSNNGRIVNGLFARNSTASNGAALYLNTAGTVEVLHSTVVSPTVANGAAIYVAAGTVGITNTILANHATALEQVAGSVSEDYNLFSGNTTDLSGSISSGGNSLTGDPAFQSMCADNYHLAPGSAAFNAAIDAGVPSDFEGDGRPLLGGYDIGADELDSLSLSDVAICGVSVANSSAQPVNSSVSFTASLSGGTNVSYTWNFGDGTILSASNTTNHSYSSVGSYTAIVTASNSINTLSASTLVTVTPDGDAVEPLSAGNSATLVYHAPDGATVTVEVPSGTITQSLYLVYNTEITPTTTPGNLIFGNRSFHLEAWLGDQILSGLSFDPPLTLTLDYLASDVSGLNEDLLEIYYFDTTSNQWSNAGMTVVERDPVNHRIVVQLSHLTEFALFQPTLPPVVMDDADLTLVNTPLSVYAPGVLANDSDPEGATLSAQLVTPPSHGSVTLASNGGFVYTPTTDYSGMDSFQYTASDGQYAITGTVTINVFQTGSNPAPIVLPEAGWNLFGYPLASSHPVTEVLASISGVYTTVFGYDPSDPNDPWRMYDPSIPAPFDAILNRLTSFDYGQGYWINLAQPATITLPSSVVAISSAGAEAVAMTPQPPATYYGELSASDNFVPQSGMAVEAWIGDSLCGQSTTQLASDGRVIYALHVQAANSGTLQGCGASGKTVKLLVDGILLTTLPWSNDSLQAVPTTQPEEVTANNKRVYLPLVSNR